MRQPSLALRRLEQYDPVSIVFALHAIGLIATDSLINPLPVALLILGIVTVRVVLGSLAKRRPNLHSALLIRGIVTLLMIGGVIVADGVTESPFFFWLLLLLAWQAVTVSSADFRVLVGTATVVYVTVVLASGDLTAISVARFGLFVAFILVMGTGRVMLEIYESRIRRLEQIVGAVVSLATMGVVVYDSDRQTPLFANEIANKLGLSSYNEMAHLVPNESANRVKIDTLASLVEDAGWLPYEPRLFHVIGDPARQLRIGIHALRLADAQPVVLVYGEPVDEPATSPQQPL